MTRGRGGSGAEVSECRLHDLPPLNLKIDGHDIISVTQQKLFGLLIDDKLMWSAHIDNLCSALSSKISLFTTTGNVCFN